MIVLHMLVGLSVCVIVVIRPPYSCKFLSFRTILQPYYQKVFETCEFAWRCRMGGSHHKAWQAKGPEIDKLVAEMDEKKVEVHTALEALGLARVKDTFVGDQDKVRGVSGGERRRVTVAEMMCIGTPVLCCDEISTGLDGTSIRCILLIFVVFTTGILLMLERCYLNECISHLQPLQHTTLHVSLDLGRGYLIE